MSGPSQPGKLMLELSRGEAALIAAALRQYEPYWSPADVDAAEKLSDLALDIRNLLDRLRDAEPPRGSGRLGRRDREAPILRLASSDGAENPDHPV
jgi:hypothetical protein